MTDHATASWKPVVVAIAGVAIVSTFGALVSDAGPWYDALQKPSWQPPKWLFGPVWTTIFVLTAIAGVIGWRRTGTAPARTRLIVLFAANMALNMLWSWLFFRAQRPDFAMIEVVALWASVLLMFWQLWPHSRPAGLLLLPYLLWVTFAANLNLAIVSLNQPFA